MIIALSDQGDRTRLTTRSDFFYKPMLNNAWAFLIHTRLTKEKQKKTKENRCLSPEFIVPFAIAQLRGEARAGMPAGRG